MALAAVVASCGDDPFDVIEQVQFDSSLDIDLSQMQMLASGVYIRDLVDGTGATIADGNTAMVQFTGWLSTGLQFGSGQFSYVVGAMPPEAIPGFEEGMQGQQVGGTRLIIIPPALGYGATELPDVPPGSILVFEVELLSLS